MRLPSLYKHIESLDALRRGIAEQATRELATVMTDAAVGRAGSDALHAVADRLPRLRPGPPRPVRGHGSRARIRATRSAPPPPTAILRVVFAILAGYGISGDDAVDATRALRAALHGFVTLEAAGGFGMPREVDRSFDRFLAAFDAALAGWVGADRDQGVSPGRRDG